MGSSPPIVDEFRAVPARQSWDAPYPPSSGVFLMRQFG